MRVPSAIERALLAAGRPVELCPECGAAFDPSVDYKGHSGAPRRVACSEVCRRLRSARRRRDLAAYDRETASLRALVEAEARGQLPIPTVGPLPPLPAPPPIDAPVVAR